MLNGSLENQVFLESLVDVLESGPTESSIILLGDFNTEMSSDSVI